MHGPQFHIYIGVEVVMKAKKSKKLTGGGQPPTEPSAAQQKILDLGEDTPGFTGLSGGMESSTGESVIEDVAESIGYNDGVV